MHSFHEEGSTLSLSVKQGVVDLSDDFAWFETDPLPIICTLLDCLASGSVPVSPILDFVLAYQVTLIEIRKYTESENKRTKDIKKPFIVVRGNYLNMMGFGQRLCLTCWHRWKHWIQTTWTLSAVWRDWHDPRLNITKWSTTKLLINCVVRTCCPDSVYVASFLCHLLLGLMFYSVHNKCK